MTPQQIEAYVDAAAAALQLPLAAAHRPGVLHYFALAATLADALEADALLLTDDPAETFWPVEPVERPATPIEPGVPVGLVNPPAAVGDRASPPGAEPR